MSDWADMDERETIAKAVRDTMWAATHPAPAQSYIDSLPLTALHLNIADAVLAAIIQFRNNSGTIIEGEWSDPNQGAKLFGRRSEIIGGEASSITTP